MPPLFKLVVLVFCELWMIQHVCSSASECKFCIGAVTELSGHLTFVGEWIAGGYKMAVRDYLDDQLPSLTNNIFSLNETCAIGIDLRDLASNIKVGIQEVFDLSATFDKCSATDRTEEATPATSNDSCSINMPFIAGPSSSGDVMTTNPIAQAFHLLQFSPIASSTFLSSYPSLYRAIPSDDTQAKALIDLCFHFNWHRVGILYMATDYGTSLQRAITSYANLRNIESTTFSYISRDNVTLENSVQSMRNSDIFIFILIVYDGDVVKLSSLLRHHHMRGYPYYYLGVDGWLYSSVFVHSQYLDIYGGMIGTCPWAPRMTDDMPYPLNISLAMYKTFYHKWVQLQADKVYDVTYNRSEPAIFTIYAYDVMLTVIKLIDEFIYRNDITEMDTFWALMYNKSALAEFVTILNEVWFMGLTGNITFSQRSHEAGDRMQGLFSYCNIDPVTSGIHQIGYNLANEVRINESSIIWPLYTYGDSPYPLASYKSKTNGIVNKSGMGLPIFIWLCIFLSIVSALIYLFLMVFYRNTGLVRAAQWKLNIFMVIGCMVCYVSLLLQGVDETFPAQQNQDYNWDLLCNFRFFTLNLSFSLIYGPLCAKIYRINKIFRTAMIQLKKQRISDQRLLFLNFMWTSIDSVLCLVVLLVAPFTRQYEAGEMVNFATTEWGSCVTPSGWVYAVVLGAPKLIFSLYCIVLSISVYSTVSMMKFNEGLQVLVCIVISSVLIFITAVVVATTTINSATQSVFVYSFMSFMVLMVCHFCCAVMVLPRVFAIWRGHDEEAIHDEAKAAKEYLKKLKSHLNMTKHRFTEDLSKFSDTDRDTTNNIGKRASYSVSLNKATKPSDGNAPTPMMAGSHVSDLPPLAENESPNANNNNVVKDGEDSDSDGEIMREASITGTATDIKKESNVFDVVRPPQDDEDVLREDEDINNVVHSNSDPDNDFALETSGNPDSTNE